MGFTAAKQEIGADPVAAFMIISLVVFELPWHIIIILFQNDPFAASQAFTGNIVFIF